MSASEIEARTNCTLLAIREVFYPVNNFRVRVPVYYDSNAQIIIKGSYNPLTNRGFRAVEKKGLPGEDGILKYYETEQMNYWRRLYRRYNFENFKISNSGDYAVATSDTDFLDLNKSVIRPLTYSSSQVWVFTKVKTKGWKIFLFIGGLSNQKGNIDGIKYVRDRYDEIWAKYKPM